MLNLILNGYDLKLKLQIEIIIKVVTSIKVFIVNNTNSI